ncbi:unnamed protein product [Euphydryas editha]|uniref:Uncharacterized protein n=1 Tax=Euphydryas editha TaxID=104508 RepID=A0AAU9ULW8_EUPED|nr:unnamed protein product [Euphydryas editha]
MLVEMIFKRCFVIWKRCFFFSKSKPWSQIDETTAPVESEPLLSHV